MQNKAEPDVLKRFSTYGERAHLEGLKIAKKYSELPKVILIIIMAENLPELKIDENYYHIFNDRDKFCPENIFCDDVVRRIYEDEEWARFVENANREANRDAGRAEGRAEGLAEGKAEARKELIRTMAENGVSARQIADMLKAKMSEIEEIIGKSAKGFSENSQKNASPSRLNQ